MRTAFVVILPENGNLSGYCDNVFNSYIVLLILFLKMETSRGTATSCDLAIIVVNKLPENGNLSGYCDVIAGCIGYF